MIEYIFHFSTNTQLTQKRFVYDKLSDALYFLYQEYGAVNVTYIDRKKT